MLVRKQSIHITISRSQAQAVGRVSFFRHMKATLVDLGKKEKMIKLGAKVTNEWRTRDCKPEARW